MKTLIVAHVLSRWAILPVGFLPPAKPGGAGKPAARRRTPGLAIATILAAAAAIAAGAAIALAAAALTAAAAALLLHRTLGGITGDGYGATAKLTEVVVCVTLVAFWG